MLVSTMLVGAGNLAVAQQTFFWRAEATNGNWSQSGNWIRMSDGSLTAVPGGSEIITFDNSFQPAMFNDLAVTNRFRINFFSGTVSRTIGGNTANSFFDFGGQVPAIYNGSGNLQTIGFKVINGNENGARRFELNADSGSLKLTADLSASGGSQLTAFMGNSNVELAGAVTQEAGATHLLNKEGGGVLTFSGTASNTYTGLTNVSAGTVFLNKSAGTVAIGGNLKVGDASGTDVVSWGASNQVADSANVEMNGGTLLLNDRSEGTSTTAGMGTLTLSATSTLNLSGAIGSLVSFAGSTAWNDAANLLIEGWTGSLSGGGADQLYIGFSDAGVSEAQESKILFVNPNGISGTFASRQLSSGEIVPVPEPAVALTATFLVGLACFREQRRVRR